MIHFLTVHFRTAKWIDVQLAMLARVMAEPYRVHAVLDQIQGHTRKFASVLPGQGSEPAHSHADNLDALATAVPAADDDLLIFIDSDAWPVVDPMPYVRAGLDQGVLVAVRRAEAMGSQQPHPMFCAVPAGTWRELGATWRSGYRWRNALGETVTDTGAGVLEALAGRPWTQWLRCNRRDLHRVFFGLYGPGTPVVYHHGAGSRPTITRWDKADVARRVNGDPLGREGAEYRAALKRRKRQLKAQSAEILQKLLTDPEHWRRWA